MLCELAFWAAPGGPTPPNTVLDLQGRVLGGALGTTDLKLVLGVPGTVLRNGALALPKGWCLEVLARAHG